MTSSANKKLRSIFRAALITAVCIPFSSLAQNSEFEWGYGQYNDDQNKGRMTSYLGYSIPETDASMVSAHCSAGSSGNFSLIEFGTDTSGFNDGQQVDVKFSTGNFNRRMNGTIVGTNAEVGISGVQFTIDNGDPLWDAMKRGISLKYSIEGKALTTLSLRDSSTPINNFLEDCMLYAADFRNSGSTPTPKKSDPRWASCRAPENQKSRNLDTPITVTFANKSEGYRSVFWMDFDGKPVNYANLNAGEEFTIQTSLGHPWMFTDGPGNCIEMFQPQLGVNRFEIGAPSPSFGPE
ncbi:hypothetical protein WNY59_16650 [Ahrensia kielensis]|uniref:von Hippel-Lindau disease tumour suppressor beta domain-containing protein n=1 Tax=Ahrensia kielensis TaxID=76980 RepID=A0ABU9TC00_9HYPH